MEKLKAVLSYNKRMVFISITCMMMGILGVGIGFALVNFDVYKLNPDIDVVLIDKEKSVPIEDINEVKLDVRYSNVRIERIEGEQFQIQYEDSEERVLEIDSKNKILSLTHPNNFKIFQFNWMDLGYEKNVAIKLQIPMAYTGSISVENGYGDIHMNDITGMNEIYIENSHDDIDVKNMEAKKISISNSYGSIMADNLIAKEDVSIENQHDEIDVKNIEASKVTIDNAYGYIKANHIVSQSIVQIENNHNDSELSDIRANDFIGSMSYGCVQIDTMDLNNEFQLENEHDDVILQNVKSLRSRIDVSYGEVVMREWVSDDIEVDVDHGNITTDVLGIEKEYHITSDVENGESNLAKNRNPDGSKKLSIILSYGDAEVNFIE